MYPGIILITYKILSICPPVHEYGYLYLEKDKRVELDNNQEQIV